MMTQRHVNGFVLIEAIIAILILGVCLVSLAAGLDRLSGALQRAEGRWVGGSGAAEVRGAGWDWGARVVRADWRTDGSLALLVLTGPAPTEVIVGIWLDGWLIDEVPVSADGVARVPAGAFVGREAYGEVIVRARTTSSGWGVPWRVVTPEVDVGMLFEFPGAPSAESRLTIHLPAALTDTVTITTAEGCSNLSVGTPFPLGVPSAGMEVGLGGKARQVIVPWYPGETRDLDVFF